MTAILAAVRHAVTTIILTAGFVVVCVGAGVLLGVILEAVAA